MELLERVGKIVFKMDVKEDRTAWTGLISLRS
jgi:hypothetical protein